MHSSHQYDRKIIYLQKHLVRMAYSHSFKLSVSSFAIILTKLSKNKVIKSIKENDVLGSRYNFESGYEQNDMFI